MYPLFGPLDIPNVHRAMYLDDELESNAEKEKKKKKKDLHIPLNGKPKVVLKSRFIVSIVA